MKQGRATNDGTGGQKREPVSHAVSPAGANQLGKIVFQNPDPLYEGRGYSAPVPVSKTVHPTGTQGKHK